MKINIKLTENENFEINSQQLCPLSLNSIEDIINKQNKEDLPTILKVFLGSKKFVYEPKAWEEHTIVDKKTIEAKMAHVWNIGNIIQQSCEKCFFQEIPKAIQQFAFDACYSNNPKDQLFNQYNMYSKYREKELTYGTQYWGCVA